jgi:transposase-like protein
MLNIQTLIDDAKCFETVRTLRWPEEVYCVHCRSTVVSKQGRDTTQPERQKYRCGDCGRWFDDLTGTVFAGYHQPLRTWVLCLYFMGLNLSNRQIASELGLHKDDAQRMTKQLRQGIECAQPDPQFSGEVEADEVYVSVRIDSDAKRQREATVKKYLAVVSGPGCTKFGVRGGGQANG